MEHIIDLDIDIYHERDAIGSSMVREFCTKSPYAYKRIYIDKRAPEERDINFGKIAHLGLLEPDKFRSGIVVAPEELGRRGTKAWTAFEAEHAGKEVIKQSEAGQLVGMAEGIERNPSAINLLKWSNIEHSFFAEHGGMQLKARPDMWLEVANDIVLIDYKTVGADISDRSLNNLITSKLWYIQAGFHAAVVGMVLGKQVENYFYMMQSTYDPYTCRVIQLGAGELRLGWQEAESALDAIKLCMQTDVWPEMNETVGMVELNDRMMFSASMRAQDVEAEIKKRIGA